MTDARKQFQTKRMSAAARKKLVDDICDDDEPFTYLIAAGDSGAVKIGRAKNVEARLSELQVGNHEELRLIRVVYGDDEAAFHERFASNRIRGEWFRFCEEMLTFATPAEQKFQEYRRLMEAA